MSTVPLWLLAAFAVALALLLLAAVAATIAALWQRRAKVYYLTLLRAKQAAAAALQAALSRQQTLLAAIPDIVVETDADEFYVWANQAGLEFFGEDLIGKGAGNYLEGREGTGGEGSPLTPVGEGVVYVESWQRRRDGEKRLLAWWSRALKDSAGAVVGVLSSARDITEFRQAQRLREEYAARLATEVQERTRELREA